MTKLWLVSIAIAAPACGQSGGGGGDADSDVDSDVDTDADTDVDSDTDSDCNGCMSGPTCLAGNTVVDCGRGGGPCQSCQDFEACIGGACDLDPEQEWTLTAVDGSITDSDWDPLGNAPDAYVIADMGNRSVGPVAWDTLLPSWTYDLYLPSPTGSFLDQTLSLEIYDCDRVECPDHDASDETIGVCDHTISESDMRDGQFTVPGCGLMTETNFEITPSL